MNGKNEMGRRKVKRHVKVGKLVKWLQAHIASILTGMIVISSCLVVVIGLIMTFYAWIERTTVVISFENGWPPIVKVNPDKAREKVIELSAPKRDYSEELVIPIELLPKELQGSREESLLRISMFWQEREKQRNNIWRCCGFISMEIAQQGSIDTNMEASNYHTKEVYRAIQIFMNVIGYYDGKFDGDQGRTKAAVDRFQKENGLRVDSKLGDKTFRAMKIMLGNIAWEVKTQDMSYCWLR